MIINWIIFIVLFGISLGSTYIFIKNAEILGLVDIPNRRSSHQRPIPRGGGLAFAFTFFLGLCLFYSFNIVPTEWLLPLFIGGPLVTMVGFLDDRRSMRPIVRLGVHFIAAFATFALLTQAFSIHVSISFLPTENQAVVAIFSLLFVAWMINLFNFMDGVDGMAGTQAVVVGFLSALLSIWQGNVDMFLLYLLLAFSVLGFLIFNWPPAKIFMGDSGAYFLGFTFSCLALMNKVFFNESLVAHVILLGVFIVDSTFTLIVRLCRKQKVYLPHRDHAFQHAIRLGWSHQGVTIFYNLISIFWLGPLAVSSVLYSNLALLFLVVAYTPLILMMIHFKAGFPLQDEKHESHSTVN